VNKMYREVSSGNRRKTPIVWLAERKKAYLRIMYMNFLASKFDMIKRKFEAILANSDLLLIIEVPCIGSSSGIETTSRPACCTLAESLASTPSNCCELRYEVHDITTSYMSRPQRVRKYVTNTNRNMRIYVKVVLIEMRRNDKTRRQQTFFKQGVRFQVTIFLSLFLIIQKIYFIST
jgi:hypothetical protein